MWKVYADTFRIATRLEPESLVEQSDIARRPGWLARVFGRNPVMVMATSWDETIASGRSATGAIGRWVRHLLADAKRRHETRRAAVRLLGMDAYLLRDIGITRYDLLTLLHRQRR